jgi:putative ABC transport system permease protein
MARVEMGSHKLRSALSILGVLFGVASLVAMLTLIGGVDVFLNKRMAQWAGSIWIWRMAEAPDDEKIAWSRSPGLRFSDGPWLERDTGAVDYFHRVIEREERGVVAGERTRIDLRGVTPEVLERELEHASVTRGRTLDAEDFASGRRVCLVSWRIEDRVLRRSARSARPITSLLGEEVLFRNVRFTVVGVFTPLDPDFEPWQLRRAVLLPLRTMQQHVTGFDPNPGAIRVSVRDPKKIAELAESIAENLETRHRGVRDFEYRTADWLEEITRMLNNVSLLMSVISMISLLVGGLSIMNVMLSSIAERVREIGVRKALGAKNGQIFVQFVAESVALSCAGGVIGSFLGLIPLAFKDAIMKSTDGAIEPTILASHVVYVFAIIVMVGVVFGLYPAIKASRMNPIDALRYE